MKTQLQIALNGEPIEPNWQMTYVDDDLIIAREQWAQIIREMRIEEILTVANGHAIMRLVDFRIQYERARRHVAEYGPVFPVKKKDDDKPEKQGQWNPMWGVMRHCDEAIMRLETELGISPLRRDKAGKVQKRNKEARAADAYLTQK
jgi:phage terminase small subunit